MEVTVEVAPAATAVTETRYTLTLTEHEARVLRAVYGRSLAGSPVDFLAPLNRMFPAACPTDYAGISRVRFS